MRESLACRRFRATPLQAHPMREAAPQKTHNQMNCLKNSLWQVEFPLDSNDVLRERFPEHRINWGNGL